MATEPHTSDAASGGADDELTGALERGEFFLLFQPTIDLETDAVVGAEVLLRWKPPTGDVVTPDVFLPRLEANGLIIPVGAWVLRTACSRGARWHAKGHRFSVSVNLSPSQLAPELPPVVSDAIDDSGFDPHHLILEFPGKSLVTGEASPELLGDLRSIGVRLAVDDFGADADVVALLQHDHVIDVVKIDRDVVQGLSSTEGGDRVRELIELGRSLHVQTVAQGIEDDDLRLELQGAHVDVGQGFLFSRPHTESEIDRFLEDYAIFSGRPL
jgi:EAL domain-containing protein (putative c-di-GMP-specific phosphodiesterase class I)